MRENQSLWSACFFWSRITHPQSLVIMNSYAGSRKGGEGCWVYLHTFIDHVCGVFIIMRDAGMLLTLYLLWIFSFPNSQHHQKQIGTYHWLNFYPSTHPITTHPSLLLPLYPISTHTSFTHRRQCWVYESPHSHVCVCTFYRMLCACQEALCVCVCSFLY